MVDGPELHETSNDLVDVSKVNEITNQIKELADTPDPNPEMQKQLNDELSENVLNMLSKLDDQAKGSLRESIMQIFERHHNEPGFEAMNQGFVILAQALGLQKDEEGVWREKDEEDVVKAVTETETKTEDVTETETKTEDVTETETKTEDVTETETKTEDVTETETKTEDVTETETKTEDVTETESAGSIEWPKPQLNGSIGEIADGSEMRLTNKLIRNAPTIEDGKQDENPSELRFYESFNNVGRQLTRIESLLSDENLKDNEDLKGMKDLITKIQKVMNNTTKSNVNELQKFIYNNLDDEEFKTKYETANHRRSNGVDFDGDFGTSTLAGLNIVLGKIDNYVTLMETKLGEVKQKAEEPTKPEETDEAEEPAAPETVSEEPTLDTKPLTIGDGQYLLMENSRNIASKAGLNGVMFYSCDLQDPQIEAGTDGMWQTREVPTNGEDYECYMKFDNRPEIYKVKIDKNGCLCPVATQIDTQLSNKDGKYLTTEVLISNNDSCKAYLRNKLPSVINTTELTIGWDDTVKDYTLGSYKRELTIEPMTIAGEWVSDKTKPDHLSKSLAFLNLTNYIRSVGDKYGNKDPNIKFDGGDGKDLWIRGLKTPSVPRGKMHVNGFPGNFGLENSTADELAAFKGYNNHERWRQDWDRKRENRIYKKM